MANVSDSSLELELSQNSYYLESASEKLSELMNKPFNVSRLFELAEHGEIAIAFSPEPSLAQRMYAQKDSKIKRFLYLNHSDIREFSPHNRNREILRSVTAFEDANYARMYNAHASGNDTKKFPTDNHDSTDKLFCENLARTELVITKEELERFIKESKPTASLEFCSYHDAGHILFNNDAIIPRMREHELEMWTYIDHNSLQLYLDKNLTQKTTTKECHDLGLSIESCYFSKSQVESFNPNSPENSGRWLTFQEVARRWYSLAPNSSPESIYNLINGVHIRTIKKEEFLLHPLSSFEDFFAADPYTDVANQPTQGMFQERQIENFEKHYFRENSPCFPEPQSIGYEVAFKILKDKFQCSAEEFTIWCYWQRADLKPYEDPELKRPFSASREEITSLSICLIGTFYNKTQIESFYPNDRYLTHKQFVELIVDSADYPEERAEQLIVNKFNQDRGKNEAPDAISDTNTLGMTWTFNFKGKSPKNAVYEKEKIESFLRHSFQGYNSSSKSARPRVATQDIEPKTRTRHTKWHLVLDEIIEKLGEVPQIHKMIIELRRLGESGHPIIEEVTQDDFIYVKGREKPIGRKTLENLLSTRRKKSPE